MPEAIHFLRPAWLWLLLPWILLMILLARPRVGASRWQEICDPHLLPHLLVGGNGSGRRGWLLPLALAGVLALLALAGPAWSRMPAPLFRSRDALVVVLDLSTSMLAQDLKPSRLERAKQKIQDLLERPGAGQTALVVFAGVAFVTAPLTDDAATILALLSPLHPSLMPAQGSLPHLGLERAVALLEQGGAGGGTVVLITDGDAAPASSLQAVARLVARGGRLGGLGVGSAAGSPVPLDGGGFLKDPSGETLLARLDAETLGALAAAGHGLYSPLTPTRDDLDRLLAATAPPPWVTAGQESSHQGEVWRDQGPWLLLLLLPLAALGFRRGWLVLALLAFQPRPAAALSWADLWSRPDQQGQAALARGDAAAAARLFADPAWAGVAASRAGDHQAAAERFRQQPGAEGHYNRGVALARQEQWAQALEAFEQALALDPSLADAEHNRRVARAMLERTPPPPARQSGQGDNTQQHSSTPHPQLSGQGDQQPPGAPQPQPSPDQGGPQGQPRKPADPKPAGDSPETTRQPPPTEPSSARAAAPAQAPAHPAGGEAPAEDGSKDLAGAAPRDDDPQTAEERQALEQWLQRIPDDPGRLLRNKFLLEHRRLNRPTEARDPW